MNKLLINSQRFSSVEHMVKCSYCNRIDVPLKRITPRRIKPAIYICMNCYNHNNE